MDKYIELGIIVVKVGAVLGAILTVTAYLSLAERRISAFIQDRLGPNRVGPEGLLQPLADGIKLFFKEDLIPSHVDKVLYVLAPAFIAVPALLAFAAIPFGGSFTIGGHEVRLQIADVNVGVLYVLAVTSLGIYGIIFGAWASNNKYALLGGLRSCAQIISYEVPLGLALVGVLLLAGSLRLTDVVDAQRGYWAGVIPKWNILKQPLGFVVFFVAAVAENNRLPFDLPEAEPELVAGYHVEYSSMKFAFYMLAEYVNMITASALVVTLYFGGWLAPWSEYFKLPVALDVLAGVGAFVIKVGFFLFVYIWLRWTLPRFRYDQLMNVSWKALLPLGLVNLFATGIFLAF